MGFLMVGGGVQSRPGEMGPDVSSFAIPNEKQPHPLTELESSIYGLKHNAQPNFLYPFGDMVYFQYGSTEPASSPCLLE